MVVIWPENSSDIDPLANPDARDEISIAAAAIKAPILVGGVVAAPGYSPDNPVSTNSVIVWNPGTGPADRHDKQIVQPFGEYLPWRSFFRHLSSVRRPGGLLRARQRQRGGERRRRAHRGRRRAGR